MKTIKHSNIYKTFDIVVVPFPFVDTHKTKVRPALVISSAKQFNNKGQTILMMITSTLHERWSLDVSIEDLAIAGLQKPSIIRPKLFTLDNRLIRQKVGKLSVQDVAKLVGAFAKLFEDLLKV